MAVWGRAWAWELREDEAELMAGSIEGGAKRRRGLDGEFELAGVAGGRRRRSGDSGLGASE